MICDTVRLLIGVSDACSGYRRSGRLRRARIERFTEPDKVAAVDRYFLAVRKKSPATWPLAPHEAAPFSPDPSSLSWVSVTTSASPLRLKLKT
jgi:hypothetical protein